MLKGAGGLAVCTFDVRPPGSEEAFVVRISKQKTELAEKDESGLIILESMDQKCRTAKRHIHLSPAVKRADSNWSRQKIQKFACVMTSEAVNL